MNFWYFQESDMPLEELLNMYGYKEEEEESSREGRSSSEEEILSNQVSYLLHLFILFKII